MAVDRADDRDPQALEPVQHAPELPQAGLVVVAPRRGFAQIVARAEPLAASSQDDGSDGMIGFDRVEFGFEPAPQRVRQRVAGRIVDLEQYDGLAGPADMDLTVHACASAIRIVPLRIRASIAPAVRPASMSTSRVCSPIPGAPRRTLTGVLESPTGVRG